MPCWTLQQMPAALPQPDVTVLLTVVFAKVYQRHATWTHLIPIERHQLAAVVDLMTTASSGGNN